MNEVVAVLLQVGPASLEGLALLARLQADSPTVPEMIALAPELEQAVEELDALSRRSREMVERCKQLKALPSPSVPMGF